MKRIQEVYIDESMCFRHNTAGQIRDFQAFIRESKKDFANKHNVEISDIYIQSTDITFVPTFEQDCIYTLVLEAMIKE